MLICLLDLMLLLWYNIRNNKHIATTHAAGLLCLHKSDHGNAADL